MKCPYFSFWCKHRVSQESTLNLDLQVSGDMKIFIKIVDGKTIALDVKRSDTIDSVKQKIEGMERIPPGQQRLNFAGREVKGGRSLSYYSIQNVGKRRKGCRS